MKLAIVTVLLLAAVLGSPVSEWTRFKGKFNKQYSSEAEEQRRFKIFTDNLEYTREHNALYENEERTFTLTQNEFSDMTHEEFLAFFNLNKKYDAASFERSDVEIIEATEEQDLPKSFDWVKEGAVTKVKSQGACGSCWAFSTTGSMEGAYFLKTKKLLSIAEQQLVDCDTQNHGCNGGFMETAYMYFKDKKPMLEADYKYKADVGDCQYDASRTVMTNIDSYVQAKKNVKSVMMSLVTYGPHSIAIDASPDEFQFYEKGVYKIDDCSSTDLDHGVLLVGYGREKNLDYWLIKNSWGKNWGDAGYIKMWKSKENMCGVMDFASAPKFKN